MISWIIDHTKLVCIVSAVVAVLSAAACTQSETGTVREIAEAALIGSTGLLAGVLFGRAWG